MLAAFLALDQPDMGPSLSSGHSSPAPPPSTQILGDVGHVAPANYSIDHEVDVGAPDEGHENDGQPPP
jgi:hypothetical protein